MTFGTDLAQAASRALLPLVPSALNRRWRHRRFGQQATIVTKAKMPGLDEGVNTNTQISIFIFI